MHRYSQRTCKEGCERDKEKAVSDKDIRILKEGIVKIVYMSNRNIQMCRREAGAGSQQKQFVCF